jgi:hypothetical protein
MAYNIQCCTHSSVVYRILAALISEWVHDVPVDTANTWLVLTFLGIISAPVFRTEKTQSVQVQPWLNSRAPYMSHRQTCCDHKQNKRRSSFSFLYMYILYVSTNILYLYTYIKYD